MRLTSNTKASSRRSKWLPQNGRSKQINFVAGRRGEVVEDDFYINAQAGKRDKILLAHVQRICKAHDTVMQSYYQQMGQLGLTRADATTSIENIGEQVYG